MELLCLDPGTVAQLLENNRHELSNLEMKCLAAFRP